MSNSKYCSYQRVLLLLVGVVLLSGVGCGSKKKDGVGKAGLGQGASGLELEWVRIEGGSFEMGADDEDSHSTEQPVHQVTVPTFEMTKTEVTFRQYESCVDAGLAPQPMFWMVHVRFGRIPFGDLVSGNPESCQVVFKATTNRWYA